MSRAGERRRPPDGRPRVSRQGERRRAEVLAVARRILIRDGYDRLGMRVVAERVGLQLGNLQYYFPTLDALLEAVMLAEFARNQAAVAAVAASARAPRAKLAAIARRLIAEWASEGGRIYVVLSLLALHRRRFRALHQRIYRAFYDGLTAVLRELRPDATPAALARRARLITTVLDGALLQVPEEGDRFVASVVETVQRIAEA